MHFCNFTQGRYECFAAHQYCLWPSRRLLIDSFWKNCVVIMRKLKLRLPNQEQYVKEAYAFIVVFTVVGASMLFFSVFVFFWYDNFVFIYLLIFFCSDINICCYSLFIYSSVYFFNHFYHLIWRYQRVSWNVTHLQSSCILQ